MTDEVGHATTDLLKDLWEIWRPCFNDEMKKAYTHTVATHITALYADIIDEARAKREGLTNEVEGLIKEIARACELLSEKLPDDIQQMETVWHDSIEILKAKLQGYAEILKVRQDEILILKEAEESVCKELGKTVKGLKDVPLPSSAELDVFKKYLDSLRDDRDLRQMELKRRRKEIKELFNELSIKPSLEFEFRVVNDSPIRVTDANMDRILDLQRRLSEQLEQAKSTALELREKLEQLWERLEINPAIRSEFHINNPGYNTNVIIALRKEICRCEELKRQNIKIFVDKLKDELVMWWDKCKYSKLQISEFHPYSSECFTEDLLTLLEMQVKKLEYFYTENQTIFDLLNKREQFWKKMVELEAKANEPNRFNNRGGQLLQEEKERKRIAVQLPKLEAELLSLVQQYKTVTHNDFTVFGEAVDDLIDKAWTAHKNDKHLKLSERKQAKAITPRKVNRTPTVSKTRSVIKTTMLGSNSKRKLSPCKVIPDAKRRLVLSTKDVNTEDDAIPKPSPSGSTKSRRAITVTANLLKSSRLRRRSSVRGRRRSRSKNPDASTTTTTQNETLSSTYSEFMEHLAARDHLRSSVVPSKLQKMRAARNPPKIVLTSATPAKKKIIVQPATPMQGGSVFYSGTPGLTPRQIKVTSNVIRQNTFSISKSNKMDTHNGIMRSATTMSPGHINRTPQRANGNKLTTKNLPILI